MTDKRASGRLPPSVTAFSTPGFQLGDEIDRLERVFGVDAPEATVLYCNRLLEAMAAQAVGVLGLEADSNLFGNLETLRSYALMPAATLAWAHTLRRIGNAVRHLLHRVDLGQAELAVALAERLLDWYFCRFRFGSKLASLTQDGQGLGLHVAPAVRALLTELDQDAAGVDPEQWRGALSTTAALPAVLAQMLIDRGAHEVAQRVLERALESFPEDLRLRQLVGLHLSRTGRLDEALRCLEPIYQRHRTDEETVGILAGVWKRIWSRTGAEADLRRSHRLYLAGWEQVRGGTMATGYLGINAAATALWLGEAARSRALAGETYARLERRQAALGRHVRESGVQHGYWDQLTMAEAALLAGELDAARRLYLEAFAQAPERADDEAVARAQLARHLGVLGIAADDRSFLTAASPGPLSRSPSPPEVAMPLPPSVYDPRPIPTDGIALSVDIERLVELLAENAHDVWARGRLDDGWTLGATRSDAEKKHPCLVPYAELPESEKDYDRRIAMGTLRAILALGYRIDKA